jgi:DNA-binding NtrC family response regulator
MRGSVLVVDNDHDVCTLVADILRDEGFVVRELVHPIPAMIRQSVRRFQPDVILLDSDEPGGYGQAWNLAVWLHKRHQRISVIMFTVHAADVAEAQLGESQRSKNAAFAGVLAKPFDLQVLVNTVASAVQKSAA